MIRELARIAFTIITYLLGWRVGKRKSETRWFQDKVPLRTLEGVRLENELSDHPYLYPALVSAVI